MTNNIAKFRAALEMARDYITSDLASERGAFEGHEGISRIDEINADLANNAAALAALAELEKAAAEPVATVCLITDRFAHNHCIEAQLQVDPSTQLPIGTKLYAAPPAPVAEIRDVVVTDEMCDRAYILKWENQTSLAGAEPDEEDRQWAREWLTAWRSELGPALGLVELKEPTSEECERIAREFYGDIPINAPDVAGGVMFHAVRDVLWPKEGL